MFDVYDVTLSGHIHYRELVKSVDRQVRFTYLLSTDLECAVEETVSTVLTCCDESRELCGQRTIQSLDAYYPV